MVALLFLIMFVLQALGMEIFASMAVSAVALLILRGDTALNVFPATMVTGIDNVSLLAIPFFILAGDVMSCGGITAKLVDFSRFFVGSWKGGLAYTSVVVNVIMAGVSGSAPADATAVSSVLLPAMEKDGYKKPFAAAINAAAAVVGPIIPPSIPMIFMSMLTGLSVGKLFLGGLVPGLLLAGSLMVALYWQMRGKPYPQTPVKRSLKGFLLLVKDTFFALIAPLVIIGGIVGGVVTVVEASILAATYVLFASTVIYRNIGLKDLLPIFVRSAVFSSVIMVLFGVVGIFARLLATEGVAESFSQWIMATAPNSVAFLLIINVFFLFLGMIMDAIPAMLIFFPMLLPIAEKLGIDPIHFGVVVVVNLMIGLITPPVGGLLYILTKMSDQPFDAVARAAFPYMISMMLILLLITYVPFLVTAVPYALLGK